MKKYISRIIYSPEEIEIDLFYSPDFSYQKSSSLDDKTASFSGEAAAENSNNVNNSNDASILTDGHSGASDRNITFGDYLEQFGTGVVEKLKRNIFPIFEENEVHKLRAKTLTKQLINRKC
jgi:hypothetical protein